MLIVSTVVDFPRIISRQATTIIPYETIKLLERHDLHLDSSIYAWKNMDKFTQLYEVYKVTDIVVKEIGHYSPVSGNKKIFN